MQRPLLLLGLIWVSFLLVFPFAAQGDTSYLHISAHSLQLPLLVLAMVGAWRSRQATTTRAQKVLTWILSVSVPLAALGIALELLTAVVRLGQDGWVNKDTADVWVQGPHAVVANLTIPSLMLSMLAVLALVVTTGMQGRRRLERVT